MKRQIANITLIICLSFGLMACAGMSGRQQAAGIGAGTGAVVGAVLGQAIGRNAGATIIGAGIGAALGTVAGDQIGAYMDRQERDLRAALAASEAASVQRTKESVQRTQEAVAATHDANRQATMDVLAATFRSEVLFELDSAALKPGAYAELQRVADVLKRYPDTSIVVEGHTDHRGTDTHNQTLSEQRAQAVGTALVELGVAGERIQTAGYGESRPVSSDDAANRRVRITIRPTPAALG